MEIIYSFLRYSLISVEFLTFFVGCFYYSKIKNFHWKWFVVYLGIIAFSELISLKVLPYFPWFRSYFYDFGVIPLEFIFFYWLFACKSLQNRKLFWILTILYLVSFIPHFFMNVEEVIYSFNYVVGNLLIALLVFLELHKQIKTDNILVFRQNMMFYINTGVFLFYIGTLPFFAFHSVLVKHMEIYNNYYILFMTFNIFMYLLFIAAFIWGKPKSL